MIMLKKIGHTIEIANNGKEAVDKFMASKFDLILMDGQMPVMDGFEATRIIRIQEKIEKKHRIIVATTANAISGDKDICIDAGMDDYMSKPISKADIEKSLLKWCSPDTEITGS